MPRLLAIMGSGETAPTMAAVHRELFARLGRDRARAVLLDTPFGFQENADELTARTAEYFRRSIGREITAARLRSADTATAAEIAASLARVRAADYLFTGPGSPSYALEQWRRMRLCPVVVDRLLHGDGCAVFASAAALTLGRWTIPVYEVYKVGAPPVWLDGLDVLGEVLGVQVAVVPHWDNAEGGTHDTRYCYMGERRLRVLEAELPDGALIAGIDEHTACILDLDAGEITVRGRGGLTLRRGGAEQRHTAGAVLAIGVLRGEGWTATPVAATPSPPQAAVTAEHSTLDEVVAATSERCLLGLRGGDVDAALEAVLELEDAIDRWAADPSQSDSRDRAREVLRSRIADLAERARGGARDLRPVAAPFIEAMLRLRDEARGARRFDDADRLRDALVAAGVEVRDTGAGSTWVLPEEFGSA